MTTDVWNWCKSRSQIPVLALAGMIAAFTPSATLGTELGGATQTCTTDLCGAESVLGHVFVRDITGRRSDGEHPWVALIYVRRGECLRLQVVEQNIDTVMTVVGPANPTVVVYQDDDSAGSLQPVIRIPNGVPGYYVVSVMSYGTTPDTGRFRLAYAKYDRPQSKLRSADSAVILVSS